MKKHPLYTFIHPPPLKQPHNWCWSSRLYCVSLQSPTQRGGLAERWGNCSEFAGNWKHLYHPVSLSLPDLKHPHPSTSPVTAFYSQAVLMAPIPQPVLCLPPDWIDANDWGPFSVWRRGDPFVLWALLSPTPTTFPQLQVLMLRHCFPHCPGGRVVWRKLGDPSGVDGVYWFLPSLPMFLFRYQAKSEEVFAVKWHHSGFCTVDAEAIFSSCWDDDNREMNVSLNGCLSVIAVWLGLCASEVNFHILLICLHKGIYI